MTKTDSQVIKGIAILFMLFLHLFNHMENVSLCENTLYIHNVPLAHWLTHATHPVGMFLIISGFGLFHAYRWIDKNKWRRIIKLYTHWWIILSLFLVLLSSLPRANMT